MKNDALFCVGQKAFIEKDGKVLVLNDPVEGLDFAGGKIQFEKGNLIYHDTYFGGRDFIGEEVVYKNSEPVWGMNYYGYILSPTTDEKELYGFLREALMQEYSDILPVRGAKDYQKDDWQYTNAVEGELNRFTGTEEIYRAGVLLYRAYYHGGIIE